MFVIFKQQLNTLDEFSERSNFITYAERAQSKNKQTGSFFILIMSSYLYSLYIWFSSCSITIFPCSYSASWLYRLREVSLFPFIFSMTRAFQFLQALFLIMSPRNYRRLWSSATVLFPCYLHVPPMVLPAFFCWFKSHI